MTAKIAVLVSGGGTNLQALIDAEKAGKIENGKIIVSDKLVQKNATEEKFTVKIVFNSLAGNATQGKEVTFDLIVMAEQYVPAETTV